MDDGLSDLKWFIEPYIVILILSFINIHKDNKIVGISLWRIFIALVINIIDGLFLMMYIDNIRHTVLSSVLSGGLSVWTGGVGLTLVLGGSFSVTIQLILQIMVRYFISKAELHGYVIVILYTLYEIIILAFVKSQEQLLLTQNNMLD